MAEGKGEARKKQ